MAILKDKKICDANIQIKLKSGACFINIKPLFSYDSQHVIIACGSEIRVFGIKSGECIQTLSYHSAHIISIKENKANKLQIFSCSKDGVVVRWDYMEGKALKIYNLQMEVANFYPMIPNDGPWLVMKKFENHFRLYAVSPKFERAPRMILKPVLSKENTIGLGFMDKFVVSVMENTMTIYKFDTKNIIRHKHGDRTFTCVSCHPSDFVIATGDCHGRIVLWTNAIRSSHPIRSLYHWHSLPVADLAFSPEGSYLHSGGGEASLVKWNLFSEERTILPRMGAPILHVNASNDNCYIATLHSDNVLQVSDSHRNVIQVIQGLTKTEPHSQTVGLLYDAHLKTLVMNGKPGHLQFYDIKQNKQLFNLDIASKNFLSHERETTTINIDVQKAAIDESGYWLATAEYWSNDDFSPQIWLKFWFFESEKQTFVLNTNVFLPHKKSLNCILFKPSVNQSNPVVVTTSDDGSFKMWTLSASTDDGKLHWSCDKMNYYRHFPAGSACFSDDGSLLAVAFKNVVTLWNAKDLALKAVLVNERIKEDIKQLLFGHKACSHYLICHDGSLFAVWNVLTTSITWILQTEVQVLAADPLSDQIAAFCSNQNLIIFKPTSPYPVHTLQNVSETSIISAIFVPNKYKDGSIVDDDDGDETCFHNNSQLFFFNRNQNLFSVSEITEQDEADTSNKKTVLPINIQTPFSMLQAVQKISDVQKLESQQLNIDMQEEEIFISNPMLQDPIAMCKSILPSLLRRRKVEDEDNAKIKSVQHENLPEIKLEESQNLPLSNSKDIDMRSVDEQLKNMEPTILDFTFLQHAVNFSNHENSS